MSLPGGLDPISTPRAGTSVFRPGTALRGLRALVDRRAPSRSTVPAAVLAGSESIHLGGGETLACPGIDRIPIAVSERGYGVGSPSLALPPAKVSVLNDVRVVAGQRVVIDSRGAVVAESLTGDMIDHLDHDELRRARTARPATLVEMGGTVAMFRSPWRAHFHTVVDHLPRAALLAQPVLGRFGEITLVHDGDLNGFEAALLPRLLPARVRLARVEPTDVVIADRVLLPGYVTRPGAGAIPSWYRRWVDRQAKLIHQEADGRGAAPLPRRFFIERTGTRRVRNRDQLDRVLDDHGIVAVDLTAMEANEVIRLFRDATLVVGVTGSGLANMLFSRSARVVELVAGQHLLPHFYYLATSKGLAYDYVTSIDDGHGTSPRHRMGEDVTVDIDALESLLAS